MAASAIFRRRGAMLFGVALASLVILLGTVYLLRPSAVSSFRMKTSGTPKSAELTRLIIDGVAVRGFVLSVSVDQQLTGGLKGFTQLATLGAMFNLSTVEPYVSGSKLVGVPYISKGRDVPDVMKLSDLYDWDDLRRHFKTCSTRNNHQFSSFETFLNLASRHVILVYMVTTLQDYKLFFSGRNQDNQIVELYREVSAFSGVKTLNKWAAHVSKQSHLKVPSFKKEVVLLMDARPTHALPMKVIMNKLGAVIDHHISIFHSATVLFQRWRGIEWRIPSTSFYYIPRFIWRLCQRVDFIWHNHAVRNASMSFSQALNDSLNTQLVGVHIRGERLLTEYKGDVTDCLKQLEIFLTQMNGNDSGVGVRIIHDLGHYGTSSCDTYQCTNGRKTLLSEVRKLGFPVVSFDPANFPSVPKSSGFVSFVEREYLSNVDVLVTLGWGGFQYTISQRFVQQHRGNTHNFHQICSSPNPTG